MLIVWKSRFEKTKSSLAVLPLCSCSVAQLCWTLCSLMDCSPPGSSFCGISQARTLEWVAISFSRGSSQRRDWTHIFCIGRWIFLPLHHLGSPYIATRVIYLTHFIKMSFGRGFAISHIVMCMLHLNFSIFKSLIHFRWKAWSSNAASISYSVMDKSLHYCIACLLIR